MKPYAYLAETSIETEQNRETWTRERREWVRGVATFVWLDGYERTEAGVRRAEQALVEIVDIQSAEAVREELVARGHGVGALHHKCPRPPGGDAR